jgi:hypothetical protein
MPRYIPSSQYSTWRGCPGVRTIFRQAERAFEWENCIHAGSAGILAAAGRGTKPTHVHSRPNPPDPNATVYTAQTTIPSSTTTAEAPPLHRQAATCHSKIPRPSHPPPPPPPCPSSHTQSHPPTPRFRSSRTHSPVLSQPFRRLSHPFTPLPHPFTSLSQPFRCRNTLHTEFG